MFKRLYEYRELLKTSVKKDIRGKYKGSFLGIIWSFISPLLMTLVYAIVFPIILSHSQDHYVTYLIIGILPWTYFTTVISQGTFCVIANSGIIKKVYFPREILPISVNTSGLVNFLISCIIIFLFLIFSGIGISLKILWLPLIILIQYILQLGIIFITSSIDVYIRDLEYIINFLISLLFYATPILYSSDLFKNTKFNIIMKINPMAGIIDGYRDILYNQINPDIMGLIIVLIESVIITMIGYQIYKRLSRGFAEEI